MDKPSFWAISSFGNEANLQVLLLERYQQSCPKCIVRLLQSQVVHFNLAE